MKPLSHFTCSVTLGQRYVYAIPYVESKNHIFYRFDIGNDGSYAKWARNDTQKAHKLIADVKWIPLYI